MLWQTNFKGWNNLEYFKTNSDKSVKLSLWCSYLVPSPVGSTGPSVSTVVLLDRGLNTGGPGLFRRFLWSIMSEVNNLLVVIIGYNVLGTVNIRVL